MSKTKYRVLSYFEDCVKCQCISCKDTFSSFEDEVYKYCPKCGLETSPEKRNKRYYQYYHAERNLRLNGNDLFSEEKRLVIQTCYAITYEKSPYGFFAIVLNKPIVSNWSLHSHTKLTSMFEESSASKYMINLFYRVCEEKDHVRLILLEKDKVRVIKEKV